MSKETFNDGPVPMTPEQKFFLRLTGLDFIAINIIGLRNRRDESRGVCRRKTKLSRRTSEPP